VAPRKLTLAVQLLDFHVVSAFLTSENVKQYFRFNDGLGSVVAAGSIEVRRPLEPALPMPLLSGPQVVGNCTGIALNTFATVSFGGRDFVFYHWHIDSLTQGVDRITPEDLPVIQSSLASQDGQPSIEVPADMVSLQ